MCKTIILILFVKVVLEAPTTGITQTFFCRKWLADDESDKLIERDLYEDMDYRTQRESSNIVFQNSL